ncbi:hypothetical protein [Micromonospora inositola]|uniref:hypothetical protein n=1 Tax=Micromonospora inositola TaxID=47865 RepID=UPI0018D4FFA9|nr:hypothetical protein [Micromonospora inositola]
MTGRVVAAKYGEHVYDQWSVDELLALLPGPAPSASAARPERAAAAEQEAAAAAPNP